jgi:hypothetical protein
MSTKKVHPGLRDKDFSACCWLMHAGHTGINEPSMQSADCHTGMGGSCLVILKMLGESQVTRALYSSPDWHSVGKTRSPLNSFPRTCPKHRNENSDLAEYRKNDLLLTEDLISARSLSEIPAHTLVCNNRISFPHWNDTVGSRAGRKHRHEEEE